MRHTNCYATLRLGNLFTHTHTHTHTQLHTHTHRDTRPTVETAPFFISSFKNNALYFRSSLFMAGQGPAQPEAIFSVRIPGRHFVCVSVCVCVCVCVWALLSSTVKQRRSPAGTENCAKASKKFAHVIDTGSIEVGEK